MKPTCSDCYYFQPDPKKPASGLCAFERPSVNAVVIPVFSDGMAGPPEYKVSIATMEREVAATRQACHQLYRNSATLM
jgi:hypothetical protein